MGDAQQFASAIEAGLARGAEKKAVVANVMEAARQDMEQEAADGLVGGERHDLLPVGTIAAVVLVREGDPSLVEADEVAAR
ncbi:hypothetical protein ROS1_56830 [Roseibium sp. ROS1]